VVAWRQRCSGDRAGEQSRGEAEGDDPVGRGFHLVACEFARGHEQRPGTHDGVRQQIGSAVVQRELASSSSKADRCQRCHRTGARNGTDEQGIEHGNLRKGELGASTAWQPVRVRVAGRSALAQPKSAPSHA
jgi:hypothetical protein